MKTETDPRTALTLQGRLDLRLAEHDGVLRAREYEIVLALLREVDAAAYARGAADQRERDAALLDEKAKGFDDAPYAASLARELAERIRYAPSPTGAQEPKG